MAIRAVVFDIGGVLEITPRLGIDFQWEQKLGLPTGTLGERLSAVWAAGSLGSITLAEVHAQIGALMMWEVSIVEAFMEDVWREYLGTPNTALIAYYQALRPVFKTGILSNSFVGAREREQERYHFPEMSDVMIYSHEVGLCKPDPRIYALTCERLGVSPAEMVFLDDVLPNVEAARNFGIHGVLFQNTAQAIAEIQACIGMA